MFQLLTSLRLSVTNTYEYPWRTVKFIHHLSDLCSFHTHHGCPAILTVVWITFHVVSDSFFRGKMPKTGRSMAPFFKDEDVIVCSCVWIVSTPESFCWRSPSPSQHILLPWERSIVRTLLVFNSAPDRCRSCITFTCQTCLSLRLNWTVKQVRLWLSLWSKRLRGCSRTELCNSLTDQSIKDLLLEIDPSNVDPRVILITAPRRFC